MREAYNALDAVATASNIWQALPGRQFGVGGVEKLDAEHLLVCGGAAADGRTRLDVPDDEAVVVLTTERRQVLTIMLQGH